VSDRAKAAFEALVRGVLPDLDFLARYPARVVKQNGDGTLELIPDDARIPGMSKVPIRYGVPGIRATVAPGARVLLGFAGGNRDAPEAELWESASVLKLEVTATAVEVTATTVEVSAQTVQIDAAVSVQLAGGVLPVARVGDTAGPFNISGGNPKVLG
jgi:hypothetical protein